jgi:HAD superfamily hydrolase (TIGR01459 family)
MASTFEISSSFTAISDSFRGVLLDAYGVFWQGNDVGLFPGAKEIMEKLILSGKVVGILSNSTQLAAKEIDKLDLHGLKRGTHFHFLITSGEVARSIFLNEKLPFETARNSFWVFGSMHPKFSPHTALFKDTPYHETKDIDEADFVYVSIPHIDGFDQTDPELFRKEVEKIKAKNVPMICANPDQFAHEGKPPQAVVRQGSIAKMYEEMGGKLFYIGKPHNRVYSIALEQFCTHNITNPSQILMVGDTPETDIRGAYHAGMSSVLVTQTGVMADRIDKKGLERALNELPAHDIPNYYIARFTDDVYSSR